jgi:hypothetical protein
METHELVMTPVLAKAATSISYASAGSALAFGLTANELGVVASVLLGICTFAAGRWIEYHFRQKHYLLAEAKHNLIVEQWKRTGFADRREEGIDSRRDEVITDGMRDD